MQTSDSPALASQPRFLIVDVFTDRPLAGNQLAVVLAADGLTTPLMQALAAEFHFSETAFVTRSQRRHCQWRVRIFTPVQELPMAGHPVVGTAVVLQALGLIDQATVFELGVGPSRVRCQRGRAEMEQLAPTRGPTHPDPAGMAAALSLEVDDLHPELPAEVWSTGLPSLLGPVAGLEALCRARPDGAAEATRALAASAYLFTLEVERPGSSAHCRLFAPHLGTSEDAATGSAGPLACYLAAHLDLGPDFRFEQGFEMGRPSLLDARIQASRGRATAVWVGGEARVVAEGRLRV